MPEFVYSDSELIEQLKNKQEQVKSLNKEIETIQRALLPLEIAIKEYIERHCGTPLIHVKPWQNKEGVTCAVLRIQRADSMAEQRLRAHGITVHGSGWNNWDTEALIDIPEEVKALRPEFLATSENPDPT